MWWALSFTILVFFLGYQLIPNYWARNLSNKVLRRGYSGKKEVALTFDDGPNPQYTPILLDILKEYKISATFFVLGKQVEKHPHIIKRMRAEGHTIGCHSYSHVHAWLMSPIRTLKDMSKTRNILLDTIKEPPSWFRPPWGTFNLANILMARKLNLNIAYWSIEAQDWAKDTSVEHICQTIITKVQPGSIILLHDNRGAPGAPDRTLKALPIIIERLHNQGYKFINIDQLERI